MNPFRWIADKVTDLLSAPEEDMEFIHSWVVEDMLRNLSARVALKGYLAFVEVDGPYATFSIKLAESTKVFKGIFNDDYVNEINRYIQELPNNPWTR